MAVPAESPSEHFRMLFFEFAVCVVVSCLELKHHDTSYIHRVARPQTRRRDAKSVSRQGAAVHADPVAAMVLDVDLAWGVGTGQLSRLADFDAQNFRRTDGRSPGPRMRRACCADTRPQSSRIPHLIV